MRVNGRSVAPVDPAARLLDYLRDELELTGAKEGCRMGECGACTVLVDGEPVCACLVLVGQVRNADVVTVEGLGTAGDLGPLQQAVIEHTASQCGYCSPGMIVAASALLSANERPTEREVHESLVGNLCRCTGYASIVRAVLSIGSE